MINMPTVKAGIVAVSRDCFPMEMSRRRRKEIAAACVNLDIPLTECETIVEREADALKALDELRERGANALVIFLGNFGPEGPLSILAQKFDGMRKRHEYKYFV